MEWGWSSSVSSSLLSVENFVNLMEFQEGHRLAEPFSCTEQLESKFGGFVLFMALFNCRSWLAPGMLVVMGPDLYWIAQEGI